MTRFLNRWTSIDGALDAQTSQREYETAVYLCHLPGAAA
jgi:hypothetical protein